MTVEKSFEDAPSKSIEDAEDEAIPQALFFGVSAARMRSRAKWCSILLMLTAFVPFDVIGKTPIFLWSIAPELHVSALLGAIAMPVAGIVILLGSLFTKRGGSLGMLVLATLVTALAFRLFGVERAAWDANMLPETLAANPAFALISLAAIAATGNLSYRAATRRVVPYGVGAGAFFAALFYFYPSRGEAPLMAVLRGLQTLPDLPDFRFQLGALILVFIALWPMLVALAGLLLLRSPSTKDEPAITLLATWGLPLWLGFLGVRLLGIPEAGFAMLLHSAMVLTVTAIAGLLSSALCVAVETFFVAAGDETPPSRRVAELEPESGVDAFGKKQAVALGAADPRGGLAPLRAVIIASASVVVVTILAFVLSRPPNKGTEWELSKSTPETDQVFHLQLREWMNARRSWQLQATSGGAESRVAVKERARKFGEGARQLDPGLGEAVSMLIEESDDLDLGGRKWARLVEGVNEASRNAGLPYFLDADTVERFTKDGVLRSYELYPYTIQEVKQYDVAGKAFATLRVRRLGGSPGSHGRLGFSRDSLPFALVLVDETEMHGETFASLVRMGYCMDGTAMNAELYGGLNRCGELFANYGKDDPKRISDGVLIGTERHELQHQIDGPHLPLSTTVLSHMQGYAHSSQDRVNREVSAFLAEMTASGAAPKVALVQLAQYLLGREDLGGTYSKAALICFEALSGKKVRKGYRMDGDAFWKVYEELFLLEDDVLRSKARNAWEAEYDATLPEPIAK